MEHATRIPPAEVTGVRGALIKRMIERKLGKVPTAVGVYWHNPKVLSASFGLGGKLAKWDACDEGLKSLAHMAVAGSRPSSAPRRSAGPRPTRGRTAPATCSWRCRLHTA